MRGTAAQARLVLLRELRLERSGHEAAVTVGPYVLGALLLAGLALDGRPDLLEPLAPLLVWLVVLTVAAPVSRAVAAGEHEDRTWELVRGLVTPSALITGKTLYLWLVLLVTWVLATLLSVALLGVPARPVAAAAGLLGTFGLALNGSVLGSLVGASTRRSGLVAALLVPSGVPVLLAGVQVSGGSPALPWLTLLVVYDLVLATTLWAVLPYLVED